MITEINAYEYLKHEANRFISSLPHFRQLNEMIVVQGRCEDKCTEDAKARELLSYLRENGVPLQYEVRP